MKDLKDSVGEKTEFGPGKTALYYKNVGLFSDPFIEDRLPNLEKFYKQGSTRFLNDFWNIDESDSHKFNKAFQDILDIWNDLDQNVSKFCNNEEQLRYKWIDKVFEALGWTIDVEVASSKHGVTNFPDYVLFASKEDWKKSKDLTGTHKFKKAVTVADAKGWGINLDGKGQDNKNPSFQIVNYLKQTDKSWGILTDGKYWRIYSLRSDSKHTTFYEVDLEKILATSDYERFKYFYNFFRVEAFVNDAKLNDRSFLDFVFEDGKYYSQRVENNLQERAYKVVDTICKGFLESYKNPSEEDLKEVYEYSMYYLFKLMFVLNCESKGLLEVNKQDDYYEFSLRKICLEIKGQYESRKTWSTQPRTYNFINDLFVLLKAGDSRIGVHGFGNEPFEIGSEEFYSKRKISDEHLNHALLELSCDKDDEGNLQFIDYKILSPDHIGSLFEGLLEFSLVQNKKSIELINSEGERKATGAFYTPDDLVDYVVEQTIGPSLKNKNPREILNLKFVDPAMGSGHFLLGVIKFIEAHITEMQNADEKIEGAIDFGILRKEILHCCIYGADINPLATELAKFSLWIYTSKKGQALEPLDDQLKHFDSVFLESWNGAFETVDFGMFDGAVGNPPFVSFYSRHSVKSKDYLGEILATQKNNYNFLEKIKSNKARINLSMFFFELANRLVKKNSFVGLIGDIGFEEEAYKHIRQYLASNTTLQIYHTKLSLFKGVNSQQVVTIWQNKTSSSSYVVKYSEGNQYLKTTKEKTEPQNAYSLSAGEKEVCFDSLFLGDLFDINTGVNIGGASERFLTNKSTTKTLPLYKPADFDKDSIKKESEIVDLIIFDQSLVTRVNEENKKNGSNNMVVLGDITRFMGKKIFIRQSCDRLVSNIIKHPAACNYSVFVINPKSAREEWKLELLHVLLSTDYYSKLAWDMGIIKGGGGKQPQIRKGSVKGDQPGLATIPIPVNFFEDNKESLKGLSMSEKIKKIEIYMTSLDNTAEKAA